jgi:hypothetical protein
MKMYFTQVSTFSEINMQKLTPLAFPLKKKFKFSWNLQLENWKAVCLGCHALICKQLRRKFVLHFADSLEKPSAAAVSRQLRTV